MTVSSERSFPASSTTPAAARRFATVSVGDLLDGRASPEVCDDVELVVSELVTNAVRTGSDTVGVRIDVADGRIGIHVTDHGIGWPEPREAGIHDTGGRGLALVSALSSSWGVRLTADGKIVWAQIEVS